MSPILRDLNDRINQLRLDYKTARGTARAAITRELKPLCAERDELLRAEQERREAELVANLVLTVGQEVTIWPRLGPGESRDTEPGLQPWRAICVGWTADKVLIESEYSDNGIRAIDKANVR